MSSPLTSAQRDQLRADLETTAAHLDAGQPAPDQRPPGLPALYALLAPDGDGQPVRVQAEHVDPALWDDIGEPWIVLTAIADGQTRVGGRRGVYGYALAHPGRPCDPAGSPRGNLDGDRTAPCVILAVGRDGEVLLAGTGSPGPHYRAIAHGLEQLVHAAQPR